jgi:hypothetical protein
LRTEFWHDFYSERINILWWKSVRERHINKVIIWSCFLACLNLICASACFITHKYGEGTLSLFIRFQIDFLIFFIFRHWKFIIHWLSLIYRNITQLLIEVWFTIDDFNFKRERSLLIYWIRDLARNLILSIMSYGLESIDILWKGTKRR